MKSILNQLEKISDKLEDKILDRELTFEDRSERWQDSEAGERHEERTEAMRETFENIQLAIESATEFVENNF